MATTVIEVYDTKNDDHIKRAVESVERALKEDWRYVDLRTGKVLRGTHVRIEISQVCSYCQNGVETAPDSEFPSPIHKESTPKMEFWAI